MKEKSKKTGALKRLVTSAMFIAIGIVLPFFTGQIREFGNTLLPMHIPVMLCGLICGPRYAGAAGFILPILRSFLFSMPVMFPTAAAMSFELAAYGAIIGFLYSRSHNKGVLSILKCLLAAMLCGRIVWGAAMTVITGLSGDTFTFEIFLSGAVLNAIPGIILQIVLVPSAMMVFDRTGFVRFSGRSTENDTVYREQEQILSDGSCFEKNQ